VFTLVWIDYRMFENRVHKNHLGTFLAQGELLFLEIENLYYPID
jgi:hypothetical protein